MKIQYEKNFFLLLFILISFISKAQKQPPYYIINVAAVKTESEAKNKALEILNKGYKSGYLWIPEYASLSGANFYSIYIGPFATQYECEVATEEYRKKHPEAYGLLVSQENQRVQINGLGKVVVSKNKTLQDVAFKIENIANDLNPSSKISFLNKGKTIYITTITGNAETIAKGDFLNKGIPKNAISACGAWWAGAGVYFYAVQSPSGIVIYQGWQEEGQINTGYHWKKIKEFF